LFQLGKLLWCCTLAVLSFSSFAQVHETPEYYQQQLTLADKLRTVKREQFNQIISALENDFALLSIEQKYYFKYLKGYQKVIVGDLIQAIELLDDVIQQDEYKLLKHRAIVTKVNAYTSIENYQDGFIVLKKMLPMLEEMSDRDTFHGALFVVAMFYNRLSQYQLSQKYVSQLLNTYPTARYSCLASMLEMEAKFRLNELNSNNINKHEVNLCIQENEHIASSIIMNFMAQWHLKQGQTENALSLLTSNLEIAKNTQYYFLISDYFSLIAQCYYLLGNYQQAELFARKVLDKAKEEHKSEAFLRAMQVLYQLNKKAGNFSEALKYHELYQQHHQLLNEDKNKRNISYQIAQKDNRVKTHEISLLAEKNKRLNVEKQLFEQAAKSRNLQIIMLSCLVLTLIYWALRSYRVQNRLKNIADHDELTGIFNRRCFQELADSALRYCNKTHQSMSLIMFDLDYFKKINDKYGHPIGDWALKKTIETCQQHCRKNDIIGRFGGEEFTILLPGCDNKKATELAEVYRNAIAKISTAELELSFKISASFGVCSSQYGYSLHDIIKAADVAMYHAKQQGRNRVSVFGVDVEQHSL
jgi:diguanylate cyclase (GGDEF)-like protein